MGRLLAWLPLALSLLASPAHALIGPDKVHATSLELGAAGTTDTTLTRCGASVLCVEGVTVLTTATGQPLDADLTSWAAVTRAAGFDAWVATPSSANLATLVTDETGSGALVFGTAPDLTISATTEGNIESAIDTLANLTSVQGFTVTLADAGADAVFGWDDSANAYENLTAAEVLAVIEASTPLLTEAEAAAAYQPLDADLTSWAGVTRASGFDTFAATPSSANLRSLMTDEIDTGVLVFLGTPADDSVPVGDSASDTTWRALPDCGGAADTLNYTAATNSFSCGSDAGAGGAIGGSTGGTDNAILRADGTGGSTVQNSVLIIADTSGAISGAASGFSIEFFGASGTDTTLTAPSAGDLNIEGNRIYRAGGTDVAVADGGTGASSLNDLITLSTHTTGSYVQQVADGTGIDGTANAEGATYTPTLDTTEISSMTWGAGSFTTETFDAGATDPVWTYASDKVSLTSAAELTLGSTTTVAQDDYASAALTPRLQVTGTTAAGGAIGVTTFANSATTPASLNLGHAAGASVGTFTAVTSGDDLAVINFTGADGTNNEPAASILVEADAATGANDMPGRLTIATTADGAATPTARVTWDSAGNEFPATNDGVSLGKSGNAFADLWLAAGGTIEFNGGTAATFTCAGTACSIEGTNIVLTTRTLTGGTGIAAIGDLSADRTITFDATEISSVTWGAGSFTTETFDAGATDPVWTYASNKVSLTSAAELTLGSTTTVAQDDYASTALTPAFQVSGTAAASGSVGIATFANSATTPASLNLGHAAGASVGTFTAVTSGDDLAVINFTGADGTNNEPAASILVEADAATGANDMPGRLTIATTADGAATPTARVTFDSSGNMFPATNDGVVIGKSGNAFADVWLASGGTIEWDGGTTNTLTCTAGDCTIEGNRLFRVGGTDVPVADGGTGASSLTDLITLGTHTTGVYVAQVADGTGIDGTANAEGATYTPTLDLTEISSATWGAGAFTTFTYDAGAVDPTETFGSGTYLLEAVASFRQADAANAGGFIKLLEDPGTGSNFIGFQAPASITSDVTCTLENDGNPIPDSCVGDGVDDGAGAAGDNIRVEDSDNAGTYTAATDADFEDSGDINFVLTTAPSPDELSAQLRTGATIDTILVKPALTTYSHSFLGGL